jgi:drug/metabolite transporter (DMT)-like permease
MLSILLGFLGYSILNIAQAGQKIGLSLAKQKKAAGRLLWAAATLGTSVSVFVLLWAVSLGTASLVGAMAGTGLAALAVFAHFVMKERVGKKELAGIVIIISGAALIGYLAENNKAGVILLDRLFILLGVVVLLYTVLWIVFARKDSVAGIIIGGFAGALGGFIPLFQKVSTSAPGKASAFFPAAPAGEQTLMDTLLSIFANPYALVWIGLSLVSIVVLQFSYKRDTAIRIIPSFSANCLLIPVIGGVVCFLEQLHILQWLGVALILGGLFLLTVKTGSRRRGAEAKSP